MMWPPQSVKIVSTPSLFSAFATRWPPEMTSASRLLRLSVSSAVVVVLPSAVLGAVSSITASILQLVCDRGPLRRSGAHRAPPDVSGRRSALFQWSPRGELRRGIDAARAEAAGVRAAHRLQDHDGHHRRDDVERGRHH